MTRLEAIREVVWPRLEPYTPEQVQEQHARSKEEAARIDGLDLRRDASVALEEARRMADSEAERRRGTDQKAAIYLPLVAALIPLILTVVSSLWDKKAGGAPGWLNMPLLGLAVAYTAAAGIWSFRVLQVSKSHELGVGSFEKAWRRREPTATLARSILRNARQNGPLINEKVSSLKMAHAFLVRAFIAFSALLLLNILWFLVNLSWSVATLPSRQATIDSPREAIAAAATVDRLADRLQGTEAWLVLREACRAQSPGRDAFRIVASPATQDSTPPPLLKRGPRESGAKRALHYTCAGRTVGQSRAWYLPSTIGKSPLSAALPEPLNASAIPSVAAFEQHWPPKDLRNVTPTLPATLAGQTVVLRTQDQRAVAIVRTHIGSGSLAPR